MTAPMPLHPDLVPRLLQIVDFAGTFVFALSGGLMGVRKRFDLFGVLFLAFVVAVAGGVMRDLLIGAVPPAAFSKVDPFLIAMGGGLAAFFFHPKLSAWERPTQILDALGLALVAVAGAQKALAFGIPPLLAPLLGMLSGIGGGMLRDVLAGEAPFVLHSDLYALAALAGAGVVCAGDVAHLPGGWSMAAGAALCVGLRMMAIFRGWRAPVARL